jgi:putative transposase
MATDELKRANQAVYQVNYHFVWIPARRKKVLVGAVAIRLRQVCDEVAQERGWTILNLAIQPDHVHLFVEATPKEAPNEIIRAFKRRSSRVLRQEFPQLLKLPSLWTHSYFCRTAGNVRTCAAVWTMPSSVSLRGW